MIPKFSFLRFFLYSQIDCDYCRISKSGGLGGIAMDHRLGILSSII